MQLPRALEHDPRLDRASVGVLRGLAAIARSQTTCAPSNREIGREIGYSPASVKRALHRVIAAGHVERVAVPATYDNVTARVLVLKWHLSEDYLVHGNYLFNTPYDRPDRPPPPAQNEPHPAHGEPLLNSVAVGTAEKSKQFARPNGNGPSQAPPVTNPLPNPWPPPAPSPGDPFAAILHRFPNLQAALSEQPGSQTHPAPAAQPPPRSSVGPVDASREQEGEEDRLAAEPPARRPARAVQTPEHKLEHEVAELIQLLDDPVARDHALRHLQRLGRLPADPVAAIVVPPVSTPEPDPVPVVEPPPPLAAPVSAPPREAPSSAYESHLAKAQAGAAARAAAKAAHQDRLKSALANPKFKGDQDLLARLCEVGPGMTSPQVSRLAVGLANALQDGKSQARYAQLLWSISEGRLDRLLLALCYVETVEARNQKGWPLGKVMGGRLKELVPLFF